MNNINMLQFDRIDVSGGIIINKTNASKECDICHYWYFQIKDLSFDQRSPIGVMMMSLNLNNIAVLNIQGGNYGNYSKSDAVNLLENADLKEEKEAK